ncbi:hypothetical protein CRYUN_Cryun12cG0115700 [Craigia yunnanensis]
MLAFSRGSQWTGTYVMEFRDLINSSPFEVRKQPEEARFSFLKGGYVEDFELQGIAKSGAEFFVTRSYHGLEMHANSSLPEPYLIGRSGKASGYKDEKSEHGTS